MEPKPSVEEYLKTRSGEDVFKKSGVDLVGEEPKRTEFEDSSTKEQSQKTLRDSGIDLMEKEKEDNSEEDPDKARADYHNFAPEGLVEEEMNEEKEDEIDELLSNARAEREKRLQKETSAIAPTKLEPPRKMVKKEEGPAVTNEKEVSRKLPIARGAEGKENEIRNVVPLNLPTRESEEGGVLLGLEEEKQILVKKVLGEFEGGADNTLSPNARKQMQNAVVLSADMEKLGDTEALKEEALIKREQVLQDKIFRASTTRDALVSALTEQIKNVPKTIARKETLREIKETGNEEKKENLLQTLTAQDARGALKQFLETDPETYDILLGTESKKVWSQVSEDISHTKGKYMLLDSPKETIEGSMLKCLAVGVDVANIFDGSSQKRTEESNPLSRYRKEMVEDASGKAGSDIVDGENVEVALDDILSRLRTTPETEEDKREHLSSELTSTITRVLERLEDGTITFKESEEKAEDIFSFTQSLSRAMAEDYVAQKREDIENRISNLLSMHEKDFDDETRLKCIKKIREGCTLATSFAFTYELLKKFSSLEARKEQRNEKAKITAPVPPNALKEPIQGGKSTNVPLPPTAPKNEGLGKQDATSERRDAEPNKGSAEQFLPPMPPKSPEKRGSQGIVPPPPPKKMAA